MEECVRKLLAKNSTMNTLEFVGSPGFGWKALEGFVEVEF